jgi:DNA invertase Pin-like site-specific DNA recombinase
MLLSKREKEKMVINLANQGKTTREIAKEVHISLKSIGQILNKATGDDVDEKELSLKDKSDYAQAFQMFQDGRPLIDVAIELDIDSPTVICYYADYLKLVNMGRLVDIYKDVKDHLSLFLDLYRRIKKEGLSKQQIVELIESSVLNVITIY